MKPTHITALFVALVFTGCIHITFEQPDFSLFNKDADAAEVGDPAPTEDEVDEAEAEFTDTPENY